VRVKRSGQPLKDGCYGGATIPGHLPTATSAIRRRLSDASPKSCGTGGKTDKSWLGRGRGLVAVPLRAKLNNGIIERDANAAAHAYDHPLAVECRQPILEMLHEVLGNKGQSLL
jgi:hypothetical protein